MERHLPKFILDETSVPNVSEKQKDQLRVLLKIYHQKAWRSSKQNAVPNDFCLEEVPKDSGKFSEIEKMVLESRSTMHNWHPKITKIEKILNQILEKKFEEAKQKCISSFTDLKFHGTGKEGIENIPKEGFRISKKQPPNMFGDGIYFSSCASKSAQAIYTKGSNKILLCEVILGKSKIVESHDYNLTLDKIRQEGFDSVHAPSKTKVIHDEFVVYDQDQALPRYIIHYTTSQGSVSSPLPQTIQHNQDGCTIS